MEEGGGREGKHQHLREGYHVNLEILLAGSAYSNQGLSLFRAAKELCINQCFISCWAIIHRKLDIEHLVQINMI